MEWSIKERWNTVGNSNIHVLKSPGSRQENENGTEALYKEIMLKNFLYLKKCINPQILKAQQAHAGEMQRKLYVSIGIVNIKKILKQLQGKNMFKGKIIRTMADFSYKQQKPENTRRKLLKFWKEKKTVNIQFSTQQNTSCKNQGKMLIAGHVAIICTRFTLNHKHLGYQTKQMKQLFSDIGKQAAQDCDF